jgi:hypothetical protein
VVDFESEVLQTQAEFAQAQGVAQSSVSRAIASGRMKESLVMQPGGKVLIRPELGRREFEENKLRGSTQKRDRERMDHDETGNASVAIYERNLKKYQAELARLKFEEAESTLVDAESIKRVAFKIARSVRDALMAMPDRLGAELAAETDAFQVTRRLNDEIRMVLENLNADILAEGPEIEARADESE